MEFQEVMRQFDRMCKANAGCLNCPLHEQDGVSDRCSIGAFVNDSERIEREVMSWAAEHPVVYPTWLEYLCEIGVIPKVIHCNELYLTAYNGIHDNRIRADIAEKLGIKPKEDA